MISVIAFFLIGYSFTIVFPEQGSLLTKEDGVVEYSSAFFGLLAAIGFLVVYFKGIRRRKTGQNKSQWKNQWFLGLALLAFVTFGEEISWGQRIFNFETPQSVAKINEQNEFNIHNLEMFHGRTADGSLKEGISSWLTGHRLFYIFLITYFIIIPVLQLSKNKLSNLIQFLGIPIVPLWIGLLLIFAMGLAKFFQFAFSDGNSYHNHSIVEIMEANIELVLLLFPISLLRRPKAEEITGE